MTFINSVHSLVASTPPTTTAASKTTSSSPTFLIVVVVLFGLVYFFVLRPNQRRKAQTMKQNRAYEVGDEVIAGGMVGRVVRIGDGEVDIDAGDGVFTFVPQAVQSRAAYMARSTRGGLGAARGSSGPSSPAPAADDGPYDDDDSSEDLPEQGSDGDDFHGSSPEPGDDRPS